MKRIVFGLFSLFLAGLLAFSSCDVVEIPVAPEEKAELRFDINVVNATDPATRSVKTEWEDGDRIFVFFKKNGSSGSMGQSQYLTITFNGNTHSWDAPVFSGISADNLGSGGTMYGIFFPCGARFVHDPAYTGSDFRLFYGDGNTNEALNNYPIFYYYMLDTGSVYTVTESIVSGTLSMVLPDNFVYFYIDAADGKFNQSEKYRLCVEGVKPAMVSHWQSGSFHEIALPEGLPMWGYKYGNGIAFAGIMDSSWSAPETPHQLVFFSDGDPAMTKTLSGKTLTSHASVKLSAPTAANGWVRYMMPPDVENIAGINWSKWFLGSTGADDVTSKVTFRWAEIVPDRGDNEDQYFPSLPRHSLTGDYAIFDPARAILGAEWRMPSRSDYASLVANSTLTSNSNWFTFTSGENSIRFATHNVLYDSGGSNYLWTSEIADNTFCYVREYHYGQNLFSEVSSGTAASVRRTMGSNFVRPVYIGSNSVNGSVNLGEYEPVGW